MVITSKKFAETTEPDCTNGLFDDVLDSLRITGTLLLRETYTPPWAVSIPDSIKLAEFLGEEQPVHVVAFHLVESGHCVIELPGETELLLRAGEMVVAFGGVAHRLAVGRGGKVQPVETLLSGGPNIQRGNPEVGPEDTALLCGVFLLRNTAFNPLLSALPPILRSSLSRPGEFHNLSGVARLITEEVDRTSMAGGFIVERLLEVLCAETIRCYIERSNISQANWIRGVRDPVIGRAIAAIHRRPGDQWTVARLAGLISLSPSRFAARFAESVGQSPMAYLTQWRMSLACRKLVESRLGIERIAEQAGYESPAAFSRAFKKHMGMSPGVWRSRKCVGSDIQRS